MTTGLEALVEQYVVYGPFLAAFLVNILATFGDKGQLVVVTLASRYSARAVFLGAMAAFTLWSGIEVLLGQWIITIISATVMNLITGIIFLLFGIWTLWLGITHLQRKQTGTTSIPDLDDIRPQMGLPGRVLPDTVLQRLNVHGGILTSFFFIMLAEFGDKTQALTITLAGTFPSAPLAVFLGVVSALGIRTGIDAIIGERFEEWIPTYWVETVAGLLFIVFGLVIFGVLPGEALLVLIGGVIALILAWIVRTAADAVESSETPQAG